MENNEPVADWVRASENHPPNWFKAKLRNIEQNVEINMEVKAVYKTSVEFETNANYRSLTYISNIEWLKEIKPDNKQEDDKDDKWVKELEKMPALNQEDEQEEFNQDFVDAIKDTIKREATHPVPVAINAKCLKCGAEGKYYFDSFNYPFLPNVDEIEFKNKHTEMVCDRISNYDGSGKFSSKKLQQISDIVLKSKQEDSLIQKAIEEKDKEIERFSNIIADYEKKPDDDYGMAALFLRNEAMIMEENAKTDTLEKRIKKAKNDKQKEMQTKGWQNREAWIKEFYAASKFLETRKSTSTKQEDSLIDEVMGAAARALEERDAEILALKEEVERLSNIIADYGKKVPV